MADDLLAAVELLYEAPDADLEAELERDFASLEKDFLRERTALLFSGEYDERPALLSISAGAGGTEATDWTEMLLRMYLRWAERHRFPTEILDQQEGEQAGLKSVTVAVNGRRAYGWLRAERGVHRLVRISPFDSQNRRQTTFALVEVLPEADDDVEIELDWDQIRVDTFRSQGAGGQHVNKTDSAVRLTDLKTGIVAQSQNERSQTQNKEMAIKVLKSRLLERALEETRGGGPGAQGRARRGRLGQPDPELCPAPVPDGQGPANGLRDRQHGRGPRRRPRRVHAGGARARHRRGGRRIVRAGARSGVPLSGFSYRTVAAEELPACAGIWRTSINDYIVPMGQPEIAPRVHPARCACTRTSRPTDPERFVVATVPDDGRERVVAFASAVVRERFWYLSMLFVLPEFQGAGLGRALLRQVLPPR